MMPKARERLWRGAFAFVGLVLITTGTGKILDLPGFVVVVEQFRLVSPAGAKLVAYSLPFVELATGLCLVSRLWLRAAAGSAVALHLLLVGVVAVTLWRGVPVANCGCFGVFLARPLGAQTLVEDLVMLALSLGLLWRTWIFPPQQPRGT